MTSTKTAIDKAREVVEAWAKARNSEFAADRHRWDSYARYDSANFCLDYLQAMLNHYDESRDEIRALHREIADLRTKLEASETRFARLSVIRSEMEAETTDLRTKLEAADTDAARLDYIERTFSGMTNCERYLPVQMIWGKGANGRTLREACDKYMKRDAAMQESAG